MEPPSKIIGTVPIKTDLINLSWNRYSKSFLEDWLFNLKTSFLKYQNKAIHFQVE